MHLDFALGKSQEHLLDLLLHLNRPNAKYDDRARAAFVHPLATSQCTAHIR
jgi:hypothetical protein